MIGRTLSHFKITAKLGEGGMGEVYLAEDTSLKRKVALKVLPSDLASSQERLERFQREAETLAALDHPNIVTIHTVEEAEGVRFLTMQLVEGKPLSELISKGGMPLERIFEIATPLADAMAAAHEKGVVHRDLKPSNIMVTDEGRVKILDFGLAKLRGETATPEASQLPTEALTGEGRILGTMPYMSPEQLEGKEVDRRSDIFSLGVVLYEMATGERPFQGDSSISLITSIMRDKPPEVDSLRRDLPHHLGRVIRRCLQKKPENRYQAARDVLNELRDLKEEVQGSAVDEVPPRQSTSGAPARRSLVAVFIVVGLVVLGLGAYRLYRGSQISSGSVDPALSAAAAWRQSLKTADARLQFQQGLHYRQRGYSQANLQLAEQSFRRAVALEPDNPFIKGELAALLAEIQQDYPVKERQAELEKLADEALLTNPSLAGPWLARAYSFFADNRMEEALDASRRAQKADTNDYRGHLIAGRSLAKMGLVDDALEEIRAGLHKEGATIPSQFTMANLLSRAGRTDEAIVEYRKILRINPGHTSTLTNLAQEYLRVGRYSDSIPLSKRTLELQPDDEMAATNLGTAYYFLDRMPEAVEAYLLSDRLDPEDPINAYNLGDAYTKLGEEGVAREWYLKAADRSDNKIDAGGSRNRFLPLKQLALAKAGRREEAISGMELFVENSPDDVVALFTAASVHAVAGNRGSVLAYAERALRAGCPRQEFLQQPEFEAFREDAEFLQLLERDFDVP